MLGKRILLLAILLFAGGCVSAQTHQAKVQPADGQKLTAGVVQKEIRKGMDQPAVAAALGSPNIVSRDSQGRETWIYDKLSTTSAYSKSEGGVSALILGFIPQAHLGGGAGGSYSAASGATNTTQRTLTVIIKFSEGVVDEYSYHSSRF